MIVRTREKRLGVDWRKDSVNFSKKPESNNPLAEGEEEVC